MKNLTKALSSILFFCSTYALQAQIGQQAVYASYPLMPLTINPAYAGSREVASFTGIYRSRGLFTVGSPDPSAFFAFDMPLKGFGNRDVTAKNNKDTIFSPNATDVSNDSTYQESLSPYERYRRSKGIKKKSRKTSKGSEFVVVAATRDTTNGQSGSPAYNKEPILNRGGIGLVAFNDPTDFSGNTFGVYVSYAHRIFLPKGVLSIGLQSGITQARSTGVSAFANIAKFNLGAGIYYRTKDWYAGLSSPYLTDNGGYFGTVKPIFLQAGYLFAIDESTHLRVGTVIKKNLGTDAVNTTFADLSKISIDVNATVWFNNKVGLGIWLMNSGSEVYQQSILGSIEYQIGSKFRFGYAYDFKAPTVNSTNTTNLTIGTINGLHQIMLRYETDFGRSRKLDTPRFF